ncbi:Nitrogen regulatory protein P-II [compost metagenome]
MVSNHKVQETIQTLIRTAQTGEMGDGKIFVSTIEEMYNIRTGEPDETIDELM